ncbi:uncharacterized protein LOC133171488 [Saccostrea echinata]|uniref:uncharacterized protein LOC133171488 n=1 Tax=Saccostrea echinata TaxID=191078 RepID=UPI002A7EDC34|nr:uncharacterized protein LOC133171488 [Saccostrea echinata]
MHQTSIVVLALCCLGICDAQLQTGGTMRSSAMMADLMNPSTMSAICGKVGKLIMCQCTTIADGCEEGHIPMGICPMLPMIPMLPKIQCCPPMYAMICSKYQQRSNTNHTHAGNSLSSPGNPNQTKGENSVPSLETPNQTKSGNSFSSTGILRERQGGNSLRLVGTKPPATL